MVGSGSRRGRVIPLPLADLAPADLGLAPAGSGLRDGTSGRPYRLRLPAPAASGSQPRPPVPWWVAACLRSRRAGRGGAGGNGTWDTPGVGRGYFVARGRGFGEGCKGPTAGR